MKLEDEERITCLFWLVLELAAIPYAFVAYFLVPAPYNIVVALLLCVLIMYGFAVLLIRERDKY